MLQKAQVATIGLFLRKQLKISKSKIDNKNISFLIVIDIYLFIALTSSLSET